MSISLMPCVLKCGYSFSITGMSNVIPLCATSISARCSSSSQIDLSGRSTRFTDFVQIAYSNAVDGG